MKLGDREKRLLNEAASTNNLQRLYFIQKALAIKRLQELDLEYVEDLERCVYIHVRLIKERVDNVSQDD
jgi:hypothetical protein